MAHFSYSYQVRFALFVLVALILIVQGTWGIDLAHHLVSVSLMALMLLVAGLHAYFSKEKFWKGGKISHIGIAMLMLAAMTGYSVNERGQAFVLSEAPVRIAYDKDGQPIALPFEMQLKEFKTSYYDDNEHVKQYASVLQVKGLIGIDTTMQTLTTQVNQPAVYHGYRLYQDSFDSDGQKFSVIKVVKEPLLPFVYVAMVLLAIGAVLQIRTHWVTAQEKWFWYALGGLTVVFAFLSVLRIQFGVLMPALRSWWFVPHLACYMLAYAMLAIAIVLTTISYKPSSVAAGLLHATSSFLLLGMICGAVWAQQAWGDWWSWDPKECWAAATWLLCLAATHTHRLNQERKVIRVVMMILCFIAMQFTWYGINHLPAAKESIHTYNVEVQEWNTKY